MKKQFFNVPDKVKDIELWGFSWLEYVTAVPAPLVLVTGYKNNGLANATMDSWFCFSNENDFYCILGSVNKYTHMYEIVKNQKQLVINFCGKDNIDKCMSTIENNGYDMDELALSGLHYHNGSKVNAPVVEECFLNLECEFEWEKPLFDGSDHFVVCVKVVNVWIDEDRYKADPFGRYGENGYLYNIHAPIDPEKEEQIKSRYGVIKPIKQM